MGKRGQLSIFIIIAIVILFSFMLILIFSKSIGEEKIHTQILSMAEKKGAIASINSNIDSCLKFAADSALVLAGKQGGFIFKFQGGLADPAKIVQSNNNMVYWILRDPSDNPPAYPKYSNLVGIPQIPLLRKEDQGKLPSKYPFVKDEIEAFSEYQFGQCMNISQFEEKGIQIIQRHSPLISMVFGDSDTIFYLDYPLKIIMGNETQNQDKQKSYSSGIRFLSIYNIAKNLAYNDLNPIFSFDAANVNQQKYNHLNAEVSVTVNPGPSYDIITVTDTKIREEYYTLVFLRQNRNPILSYIPDYTVNISDELKIDVTAIDPDEDNVVISANYTKIDVFSGVHTPMGDAVKNNHMKFTTVPSDIGYYSYNITATDDGNLKDWQEVTVKIMCQYRAHAIRDGSGWKDDSGKMFAYNPECCDDTSAMPYLSFMAGTTTSSGCTCNETGGCEGMMAPPATCTEGDTKCEGKTSYECTGGIWVKTGTYPCLGCQDKNCGGEPITDGFGNIIGYTPPSCC